MGARGVHSVQAMSNMANGQGKTLVAPMGLGTLRTCGLDRCAGWTERSMGPGVSRGVQCRQWEPFSLGGLVENCPAEESFPTGDRGAHRCPQVSTGVHRCPQVSTGVHR